ncbi:MAG: VWA domain-containing protein [Acidobacteriaceae bacterium]|nr:VWA domain-containing protein [Acidobacteriaceae bacterium]
MPFRPLRLLTAMSLLAATFTSVGLAAQQPSTSSDSSTLHVTTQLVVLDVVVTDKKGNLVDRKLTKDDFVIKDNGVEQRIRHFETPDEHRMPAADKPIVNSAADLRKIGDAPVTVLVLDELNSRFEDMSYSRQMLVKYLQRQPAVLPQPTVLLVATNSRFSQLHDYTQDRDALIQIVKKHMPEFPYKANQRGGPAAVERMAQVLAALQQICEASTGTPGRKNLIWVGTGFPTANLVGLDDQTTATLEAAIRRVTSRLLAARITMYSINPAPGSSATVDVESPDDLNVTDEYGSDPFGSGGISFSSLAPSTGGTAFTGRNDIDNIIGEGINKGRDYYTLSYTPSVLVDAKTDYRTVHIVMKDPDLRAVTRSGYYANSAPDLNPLMDKTMDAKQARANLQLDLSSALTSTISYNGLEIHATKDGDGTYSIAVSEQGIAWSDPTAEGNQSTEDTVAAGWYDGKGKLLGHVARELTASRVNGGVTFKLPVTVPSNARRVRFVVRDARNGKMGTDDIVLK